MNKTLEGMVTAMDAAKYPLPFYEGDGPEVDDFKAMAAALLWLADNVSDKMLRDMHDAWIEWSGQDSGRWEYCLKAALRAAAGSAPTPPEVK